MSHIGENRAGADDDQARDHERWRESASDGAGTEHQTGEPQTREHRAAHIERPHVLLAQIGDVAAGQQHAKRADRHVDPENIAPVKIGRDEAPERRPDQRADERGYREPGQGAHKLRARRRAQNHQAPHGHHHGAAHALRDARQHDIKQRGGETAQDRTQSEDQNRGAKNLAGAELIRRPARQRYENRQGEKVGRQREFERDRILPQIHGHRRQGRRQYGAVEILHEQGRGDDERRQNREGQGRALF